MSDKKLLNPTVFADVDKKDGINETNEYCRFAAAAIVNNLVEEKKITLDKEVTAAEIKAVRDVMFNFAAYLKIPGMSLIIKAIEENKVPDGVPDNLKPLLGTLRVAVSDAVVAALDEVHKINQPAGTAIKKPQASR